MVGEIPIKFEHQGRRYEGTFGEVFNAGDKNVWYLYIRNYYCGRLRLTDTWVFDPTPKLDFSDLADFFGEYITLWYESNY